MPVGPGALPTPPPPETPISRKPSTPMPSLRDLSTSTLAPNTLINPPAPTNLSAAAVIVKGERGIGIGRTDASGGMPSGLMANIWGSTNWGHLNRLESGEVKLPQEKSVKLSDPPNPLARQSNPSPASGSPPQSVEALGSNNGIPGSIEKDKTTGKSQALSPSHDGTMNIGGDEETDISSLGYPNYYPLQLKTQDAQFRLLFPNVRQNERLVLVFKATWSPNEQQEFPGRAYVTVKNIYFYSNHCGMILVTMIGLESISEITAATGKECDFLFCHLKSNSSQATNYNRITIKTFIEPLSLLQKRLNFLVRNRISHGVSVEEIMKTFIKMEQDDPESSPSIDSWENVSINTPTDGDPSSRRSASHTNQQTLKVSVDRGLYGSSALQLDSVGDGSKAFKLPKQPIIYAPSGMDKLAVEKDFDLSAKGLYHCLFGDKSAVWVRTILFLPSSLKANLGHIPHFYVHFGVFSSVLYQTLGRTISTQANACSCSCALPFLVANWGHIPPSYAHLGAFPLRSLPILGRKTRYSRKFLLLLSHLFQSWWQIGATYHQLGAKGYITLHDCLVA